MCFGPGRRETALIQTRRPIGPRKCRRWGSGAFKQGRRPAPPNTPGIDNWKALGQRAPPKAGCVQQIFAQSSCQATRSRPCPNLRLAPLKTRVPGTLLPFRNHGRQDEAGGTRRPDRSGSEDVRLTVVWRALLEPAPGTLRVRRRRVAGFPVPHDFRRSICC